MNRRIYINRQKKKRLVGPLFYLCKGKETVHIYLSFERSTPLAE